MWRFKPFMPKEQNGLEGRIIDIENLKIQVRNAIAEGGFSCVYLARDAIHGPKQYAVKHIICNDVESLELVMKEISVMKSLKGHPNIVRLYAHTIIDMGRTKEALLVMEYCDKSLVNVLASRGVGYFEEKQILSIFRDVCNAVFAMHCQSPPIAHRDLKAENILLGSDGLWKLCDFGSTSTNHKCFEKPEEMGIEEDIIRKHTTPAYRAPEMWDLFRRELINEKVDIWALGCLLFCICYLKSAFDGESKLQILNGNYRIPDLPKYDASLVDLIRYMLQSSPNDRPNITQVWFCVNDLLPDGLQKSLPDRPPEMELDTNIAEAGMQAAKSCAMPCRSPPPPPSAAEPVCNVLQSSINSKQGSPLGAFWSTKHANDSVFEGNIRSKYDDETTSHSSSRNGRSHFEGLPFSHNTNPPKDDPHSVPKDCHGKSVSRSMERPGLPKLESRHTSQNDAFRSGNDELLEADVKKLKEQLKQANVEKDEITSKCEKLSAICRSQQQEIQELKQAVAAQTPPNKVACENQTSIGQPSTILTQRKKIEGSIWELQQGLLTKGSIPDSKPWQAFTDDPVPQTTPTSNAVLSVTTKNCLQNKQDADANSCDFGTESFTAVPSASSQINISMMNSPQQVGKSKNMGCQSASQPAGWAGF